VYIPAKCIDEQALRFVKNIDLVLSKRVHRDIFSSESKWHRVEMKHMQVLEIKLDVVTIADNCVEWAEKTESDFYGWLADCNRDLGQWDEPVKKAMSFEKPSEGAFTYYNASISYLKALVTFSKSELLVTLDDDDRRYLAELTELASRLKKTISSIYNYCYEINTVNSDLVEGAKEGLQELYRGLERLLRVCTEAISTGFSMRRKLNNRRFVSDYNSDYLYASGGRIIETANLVWMFRFIFWYGNKTKPADYPINHILSLENKDVIEFRRNVNTVMRRIVGERHPIFMRFNTLMSSVIQGMGLKRLDPCQLEYLENTFFDMWAIASARTILSEKEKEA
jgi:hypothetical protein